MPPPAPYNQDKMITLVTTLRDGAILCGVLLLFLNCKISR